MDYIKEIKEELKKSAKATDSQKDSWDYFDDELYKEFVAKKGLIKMVKCN